MFACCVRGCCGSVSCVCLCVCVYVMFVFNSLVGLNLLLARVLVMTYRCGAVPVASARRRASCGLSTRGDAHLTWGVSIRSFCNPTYTTSMLSINRRQKVTCSCRAALRMARRAPNATTPISCRKPYTHTHTHTHAHTTSQQRHTRKQTHVAV